MGRPVMSRSIKRNRLRVLDMVTECAGVVSPTALQAMAKAVEIAACVKVEEDETSRQLMISQLEAQGFTVTKTAKVKPRKKKSAKR